MALGKNNFSRYSSKSINVEEIKNGYLITKTICKGDDYKVMKEFSATPPKLDVEEPDVGNSSLREAMDTLRR